MDGDHTRSCLYIGIITFSIPGVSALDDALIGVIAASFVLAIFVAIALCFTAFYCRSMLRKEKRGANMRRLPEEHSTVSTVAAGYSSYSYPAHYYYADSFFHGHPKPITVYRPKVLMEDEVSLESDVSREDTGRNEHDRRKLKTINGHVVNGINLKVIEKSQQRLSEWLNTNYDENTVAMDIGEEEDNKRESLTAEQFLEQNVHGPIPGRKISTYKDDEEFTIVDYVVDDNYVKSERQRKSSTAPQMFERQPEPLPPSSMPFLYKTTIGVVQDKTANNIENNKINDDELYPASTSSPVHSYHSDTVGFENNSLENHRRQRTPRIGSVPDLPPDDSRDYQEFMNTRIRDYE